MLLPTKKCIFSRYKVGLALFVMSLLLVFSVAATVPQLPGASLPLDCRQSLRPPAPDGGGAPEC